VNATRVSDARPGGSVTRPTLDVERRLWRAGHRWVAGCDEVGRGAWAGPLTVGIAVVHEGVRSRSIPAWLRDSKALSEERRELVFGEVARWCADAAVGHASAEECDRWGMTLAWRLAARRALAALELAPDAIVIDGPWDLLRGRPVPAAAFADPTEAVAGPAALHADADADADAEDDAEDEPELEGGRVDRRPAGELVLPPCAVPETVLPLIGADARCAAVAAASVLAKVVRDRLMREEAEHFPAYSFEANKGYPSQRHQMALRGYGLSAIHRRSWSYVANLPWGAAGWVHRAIPGFEAAPRSGAEASPEPVEGTAAQVSDASTWVDFG
jgi:ribonuclease HII